jgi:hypothetical protein
MKTFDELKALLAEALRELGQLARSGAMSIEERHVKEQAIGQYCYEAEEDLSSAELARLKKELGLGETTWRAYKARFIEGSSPGELI